MTRPLSLFNCTVLVSRLTETVPPIKVWVNEKHELLV